MVEFALVSPIFLMVLIGIIVLGIGVFYHQQLTNGAREGARYAATHTATSRCPTVSNLPPDAALLPLPNSYYECDAPSARWPYMTAHARSLIFGLNPADVQLTACWSGYWTKDSLGNWGSHDEMPIDPVTQSPNPFRECTVPVYGWAPDQDPATDASATHVVNPRTGLNTAGVEIKIDCSRQFPLTTATDDMASSYSAAAGRSANTVTVVTCYAWSPPAAGFLLIPQTVHLVGVVTETLEYQQ